MIEKLPNRKQDNKETRDFSKGRRNFLAGAAGLAAATAFPKATKAFENLDDAQEGEDKSWEIWQDGEKLPGGAESKPDIEDYEIKPKSMEEHVPNILKLKLPHPFKLTGEPYQDLQHGAELLWDISDKPLAPEIDSIPKIKVSQMKDKHKGMRIIYRILFAGDVYAPYFFSVEELQNYFDNEFDLEEVKKCAAKAAKKFDASERRQLEEVRKLFENTPPE